MEEEEEGKKYTHRIGTKIDFFPLYFKVIEFVLFS